MQDLAEPQVRSLTEDEVAHFHDMGWVFVPGYLDADYTAGLLERAHGYFDYDPETAKVGGSPHERVNGWDTVMEMSQISAIDEAFNMVSFHSQTARNLNRLRPDAAGIRRYIDVVAAKLPMSAGGHNGPTNYHQDFHAFPLDRALSLTCWIALDRVAPEMGSMRFFEGSDRDDAMLTQPDSRDIMDIETVYTRYPWLRTSTTVTPEITYQPGDATIHNSRIFHGAPSNTGTSARWNYAASYFPAGVHYNGLPGHRTNDIGLVVGEPLDHPDFPIIG